MKLKRLAKRSGCLSKVIGFLQPPVLVLAPTPNTNACLKRPKWGRWP